MGSSSISRGSKVRLELGSPGVGRKNRPAFIGVYSTRPRPPCENVDNARSSFAFCSCIRIFVVRGLASEWGAPAVFSQQIFAVAA